MDANDLSLSDLLEESMKRPKPIFERIKPILMSKYLLTLDNKEGLESRTRAYNGLYEVTLRRRESPNKTAFDIMIWDMDEVAESGDRGLNDPKTNPIVGSRVVFNFDEAVELYAGAIEHLNKYGLN